MQLKWEKKLKSNKIKDAALLINDEEISFRDFALSCYKLKPRNIDIEFYIMANKSVLEKAWINIAVKTSEEHQKYKDKQLELLENNNKEKDI